MFSSHHLITWVELQFLILSLILILYAADLLCESKVTIVTTIPIPENINTTAITRPSGVIGV